MGASVSHYVRTDYYFRGGSYAIESVESDVVTELDLSGRQIGDRGAGALAAALPGNTQLMKLYMNKCDISDGGAMALSAMLQHTCIKILYLEGNRIGDRGAMTLSVAATSVDDTGDNDSEGGHGAGPMNEFQNDNNNNTHNNNKRHNTILARDKSSPTTNLQVLGLSSNNIGLMGSKALANTLKCSKTLKRLILRQNDIGNEGALAFGKALRTNNCLEFLDLTATNIHDEGAIALCNGLESNSSLKTLLLGHNHIGDEGIQAFANLLQTSTTAESTTRKNHQCLQCLDLRRNSWSEDSLHLLVRAIRNNYYLEELLMTGCDLPQNAEMCSCLKDLHYTLLLNRGGRRLLREDHEGVPVGLWPFVLGRVRYLPDMLYYFVHSNPELFKMEKGLFE
mmetsp:Transcript_1460/g.2307  ORF Transcript_1460/g.2307 Transcript_1460/m.2307 type:complete len:394 (+) Transcript_1460:338-1519(+)